MGEQLRCDLHEQRGHFSIRGLLTTRSRDRATDARTPQEDYVVSGGLLHSRHLIFGIDRGVDPLPECDKGVLAVREGVARR